MNKLTQLSGAKIDEASVSAVVIRCGCNDGGLNHQGRPCHSPRKVENRGVISYYHRNPLRRWAWAIKHRNQEVSF